MNHWYERGDKRDAVSIVIAKGGKPTYISNDDEPITSELRGALSRAAVTEVEEERE